jgi:hypothetical protein
MRRLHHDGMASSLDMLCDARVAGADHVVRGRFADLDGLPDVAHRHRVTAGGDRD